MPPLCNHDDGHRTDTVVGGAWIFVEFEWRSGHGGRADDPRPGHVLDVEAPQPGGARRLQRPRGAAARRRRRRAHGHRHEEDGVLPAPAAAPGQPADHQAAERQASVPPEGLAVGCAHGQPEASPHGTGLQRMQP